MKLKRFLVVGTVVCVLFVLLSITTVQIVQAPEPVQTDISLEKMPDRSDLVQRMSELTLDVQPVSENSCIISAGNLTLTFEKLETGYRLSSISDDGEIKIVDVTTESRFIDNTGLVERVMLINGVEIKLPALP